MHLFNSNLYHQGSNMSLCTFYPFAIAWLIYWVLIVLFGLAAMTVYFLYKDLTSYALYYTAYFL